ncbi:uncharacterized protein [Aegilops tauschii subsp. strangulata]|uniref:uncharacterized protein n=1 Tax=Aegilops tauschii subsp. strangulata TaxID=200361 RepID=UPI003CC880EC
MWSCWASRVLSGYLGKNKSDGTSLLRVGVHQAASLPAASNLTHVYGAYVPENSNGSDHTCEGNQMHVRLFAWSAPTSISYKSSSLSLSAPCCSLLGVLPCHGACPLSWVVLRTQ